MRLAQFAFLVAATAPLFAQKYEVGPYFVFDRMPRVPLGTTRASGGSDRDTRFGDGKGFGLRLTANTKGYYGHEVFYSRSHIPLTSNVDPFIFNNDGSITLGSPIDRREKIRQSKLGYNFLMYMMPAGERWRPYLAIGAVSTKTDPPRFFEWTAAGGRNFGGSAGAGIKLAVTKKVLFRFDYRIMLVGRPFTLTYPQAGADGGGSLRPMEASAGFSWAWGK